jgi:hypothetical protein
MRGFWVMWSPDSPGSDAMKTRTEPGNPEAKKYSKVFTANYKQLPRGNPTATITTVVANAIAGGLKAAQSFMLQPR